MGFFRRVHSVTKRCMEVRLRPGQETSLAPPYLNLRSFGSKCIALKKKLATMLGLFAPPSDSVPGHCYAPGVTLLNKLRSCDIQRALNVETLLWIERTQLRYFGHVSRMPHERLVIQVLLAKPTGVWPRCPPRTSWIDYTSYLAWSRLGVEPAELSKIAVDCEVFQALLGLLLPRLSQEEKQAWKWMKWMTFTLVFKSAQLASEHVPYTTRLD